MFNWLEGHPVVGFLFCVSTTSVDEMGNVHTVTLRDKSISRCPRKCPL